MQAVGSVHVRQAFQHTLADIAGPHEGRCEKMTCSARVLHRTQYKLPETERSDPTHQSKGRRARTRAQSVRCVSDSARRAAHTVRTHSLRWCKYVSMYRTMFSCTLRLCNAISCFKFSRSAASDILMATCCPVRVSVAKYTVPDALQAPP